MCVKYQDGEITGTADGEEASMSADVSTLGQSAVENGHGDH